MKRITVNMDGMTGLINVERIVAVTPTTQEQCERGYFAVIVMDRALTVKGDASLLVKDTVDEINDMLDKVT